MADIVDPETRSRMMSGIRGRNTKPEMIVRRGLHAQGYRYVLHSRKIPGKPDLVFPSRKAVIFVHGCFWHGHDCRFFRMPSTRREFWQTKIKGNMVRDARNAELLKAQGWRHLVIWECALRGRNAETVDQVVRQAAHWLDSSAGTGEIRGN